MVPRYREAFANMLKGKRQSSGACKALFAALLLIASAAAQNLVEPGPPVSAYNPTFDVAGGYSYLSSSIPSAGRVNLYGINASAHADFLPHWGVALDSGYVRASDVLGTGHPGYTLTFLGGPVFYPLTHGSIRPFLHALVGAGLVEGALPLNSTSNLQAWVARPAFAVGGGVERSVMGPFGLRMTGDYLRTAYADSTATVKLQNDLRVSASLVFQLNYHGRRE
jgi:hypothetical protein